MATMVSDNFEGAAAVPSIDDLVARARAMQPVLRERAAETERARRVSQRTMDELGDAGLLGLVKPRRFGGWEYPPSALLRVGAELARGCGSTGWCAMLANGNNWFAAYWPADVQAAVWGDEPGNLIAGTIAPTGKCEAAEGGYRVWGRWPWASNCDNSQWAFVSAMLPADGDLPPSIGWFLMPMSSVSIDQSSWFVSGMQGTGSKTLFADDPIFVPAERMIRVSDVITRTVPGCRIADNPMARFALSTFGGISLVAALVGMGRAGLDEFVAAMRDKVRVAMRPGAPVTAAQNPFAQERVGHAITMIDAAYVLLLNDLEDVERRVMEGHVPTVEERLRIRRATCYAARQSTDAVNLVMELAGASAADVNLPLQRIWRDINAASRHLAFDLQAINMQFGQYQFGIEPVGNF